MSGKKAHGDQGGVQEVVQTNSPDQTSETNADPLGAARWFIRGWPGDNSKAVSGAAPTPAEAIRRVSRMRGKPPSNQDSGVGGILRHGELAALPPTPKDRPLRLPPSPLR